MAGQTAEKPTSEFVIPAGEEKNMTRPRVAAAEALIGKKHYALNGSGCVVLVDYMGDDSSVVQAARVSYGAGTKKIHEDSGLLRYLMRHRHTTPFEMVEFKFLIELPIFVARQWIRHRTANVNEYSLRYSLAEEKFYVPEEDALLAQSKTNRQGRGGKLPDNVVKSFREDLKKHSEESFRLYKKYVDEDVARELARLFLPVNFSTKWYWKIDAHNLFHFLSLRIDPHAQYEIRQIAQVMADIVKQVVPIAYQAFEDFTLDSVRFSRKEKAALKEIFAGKAIEKACSEAGLKLFKEDGTQIKNGEGAEFVAKLEGIVGKFDPSGSLLRRE